MQSVLRILQLKADFLNFLISISEEKNKSRSHTYVVVCQNERPVKATKKQKGKKQDILRQQQSRKQANTHRPLN